MPQLVVVSADNLITYMRGSYSYPSPKWFVGKEVMQGDLESYI